MSEPFSSASPILSQATAQALEFPSLLAVVSRFAASDLGRDRVLALRPFEDEGELRLRRTLFEEASRLVGGGGLVPGFEVPLGDLLVRLTTGRPPLEGIDLVRLADLGKATRTAVSRIREAVPPCPALEARARALPDLAPLLRKIERTLDRRGEVREDASPRLAALRKQIRSTRDQIYRDLGEFVSSHKDDLSEETIPMRGGRLVLMLQSGAKGRTSGLVHGRSATGRSFYFEPLHVVETNNTLQQSAEDEEAERHRILVELIEAARAALPDLREHARFLGDLDLLQAAARFGDRCGGSLPEIGARHDLRLLSARHPLLDPCLAEIREEALGQAGHSGDIVPLDIELSGTRRILVVTGPNAGGKTVSLKTAGILSLMAQCGLPVPAGLGSRVPFLTRLVATVGDEQDLLADRSTFSGRLLRLKEAWEEAGPDGLILLDELGSGTDPEEGAALAVALLEGLLEKGSLGVITTHLTQLAAAALEFPGATCAAMEFDPETGRPTFRLVPGPPGGSEALALARRLGLPAEWLDRAEARLGSEHRDLRRLIAEVERVRQELCRDEGPPGGRARRRREAPPPAGRRAGRPGRGAAQHGKEDADGAGRLPPADLRAPAPGRGTPARALRGGAPPGLGGRGRPDALLRGARLRGGGGAGAPSGPLAVGEPVRHLGLGWEGVLEKLEDGRAEVLVRGKRVRCRPEELAPARPSRDKAPAPRSAFREARPTSTLATRGDIDETLAVPPEINLIGMRVEPALEQLDSYIDQALLASRKEVRVVHGHGSGRLRQAVRDHLRGHRGIAEVRSGAPNEGGNGATVVTFRGA